MKSLFLACFIVLLGISPALGLSLHQGVARMVIDSSELAVYVDSSDRTSPSEILSQPSRYFSKGAKNSYPYSNAAVWTRISLTNVTDSRLGFHLLNDFVAHDQVDIYLLKGDTLMKTYRFGDTRPVTSGEIIDRFANIPIDLAAHETLEVVTRYHSTSPVHIKMILLAEAGYARFAVIDLSIWGIFIGAILALAIFNLMMFASLKNVAFLYYVLNSLTNLYNTMTSSGHIYAWLSPYLPLSLLNLSYNKISPALGIIFMSLFIISFFELKKRSLWLYRMNQANAVIIAIMLISLPLFYFSENLLFYNWISSVLLPLSLLVMLVSAVVIAWKKFLGGVYFLLGAGLFFTATICYILYFVGLVDFSSAIVYALPASRAAEAILFSIALSRKVKRIETERAENALLVEESNKFNSTSYLLAGILHQFKQPLIHLGAEVLKLRTERYKTRSEDPQTEEVLGEMENQIAGMNDLVGNFYSFYSQQATLSDFDLQSAIDKVLAMLAPSLQAGDISVVKNFQSSQLCADEKAFKQILLILLENAVAALREKQPASPRLWIGCSGDRKVKIEVRDNAGGIAANDLDKVFNLHFSRKQTQGLGIGLALARKLAETRLNGSLIAHNEQAGACFTLIFNQR